jgi:hypothetical protein
MAHSSPTPCRIAHSASPLPRSQGMRSCSNVISDNDRADKTADLHPTYTLIACLLFFLLLFQFENDETLCAARARERIMAKIKWSTTRKNPPTSQLRPSAWRESSGVSGIGSAWFSLVSFWYSLEQCRLLIIRRRDSLYTYTLLTCD